MILEDQPTHRDCVELERAMLAYRDRVFAVCRRRLRCVADAEDATQEVLLRYVESVASIRGEHEHWLVRCARNVCVDRVRSGHRRRRRERLRAMPEGGADRGLSVLEARELTQTLLGRLDREERELVRRHVMEGVPQAVLAAERGVTQQMVSRRVRVATGKLRGWASEHIGTLSLGGLTTGVSAWTTRTTAACAAWLCRLPPAATWEPVANKALPAAAAAGLALVMPAPQAVVPVTADEPVVRRPLLVEPQGSHTNFAWAKSSAPSTTHGLWTDRRQSPANAVTNETHSFRAARSQASSLAVDSPSLNQPSPIGTPSQPGSQAVATVIRTAPSPWFSQNVSSDSASWGFGNAQRVERPVLDQFRSELFEPTADVETKAGLKAALIAKTGQRGELIGFPWALPMGTGNGSTSIQLDVAGFAGFSRLLIAKGEALPSDRADALSALPWIARRSAFGSVDDRRAVSLEAIALNARLASLFDAFPTDVAAVAIAIESDLPASIEAESIREQILLGGETSAATPILASIVSTPDFADADPVLELVTSSSLVSEAALPPGPETITDGSPALDVLPLLREAVVIQSDLAVNAVKMDATESESIVMLATAAIGGTRESREASAVLDLPMREVVLTRPVSLPEPVLGSLGAFSLWLCLRRRSVR